MLGYAAAGCTGSSKAPTFKNGGLNEDRFQIARVAVDGGQDKSALYVGVFDGHGGPGASSFLLEHYLGSLERTLSESSLAGRGVECALHDSFLHADRALYLDVLSLGEAYARYREERCKCSFYRESPCRCLCAPRSAHEGSTATVILFDGTGRLYCSNVGDSEALLVTRSGFVKGTSGAGCREYDSPGARSAIATPSPMAAALAQALGQRQAQAQAQAQQQQQQQPHYEGYNAGASSTPTLTPESSQWQSPSQSPSQHASQPPLAPSPAATPTIATATATATPGSAAGFAAASSSSSSGGAQESAASSAASSASSSASSSTSSSTMVLMSRQQTASSDDMVDDQGELMEISTESVAASAADEMSQLGALAAEALEAMPGSWLSSGSPGVVLRKVEPGTGQAHAEAFAETMTIADTPIPELDNEDYLRVKHIAQARVRRKPNKTRASRNDGIRRGPSSRFNYVALEGAHSLNMTRAFGNFGHKVYTEDTAAIVELQSPIIVRPHVNIFEPAYEDDFLFVVVASDGLWDNLNKDEVAALVRDYCRQRILDSGWRAQRASHLEQHQRGFGQHHKQHHLVGGGSDVILNSCSVTSPVRRDVAKTKPAAAEAAEAAAAVASRQQDEAAAATGQALLLNMAEAVSEELLTRAVARNRKLDDITVVVILFESMLARDF